MFKQCLKITGYTALQVATVMVTIRAIEQIEHLWNKRKLEKVLNDAKNKIVD